MLQKKRKEKKVLRNACLFVCWLLNVPATCECISGTDLLRQFYVLPHWDSHSILTPGRTFPTLILYRQAPGRVATGVPIFKSMVWLDPEKSRCKCDSNLGSSALKADAITTRPTRWFGKRMYTPPPNSLKSVPSLHSPPLILKAAKATSNPTAGCYYVLTGHSKLERSFQETNEHSALSMTWNNFFRVGKLIMESKKSAQNRTTPMPTALDTYLTKTKEWNTNAAIQDMADWRLYRWCELPEFQRYAWTQCWVGCRDLSAWDYLC